MLSRTGRCLTLLSMVLLLLAELAPPSVAANGAEIPPSGVGSEPMPDPAGKWVLNAGKRTIFVLSIDNARTGSQPVSGSLAHPRHLQMNSSMSFSRIEGPPEVEPIVASAWQGRILAITVQNPTKSADRTTFLFDVKDPAHAVFQIQGAPFPPIKLLRATGAAFVSTDWDVDRTYSPDDGVASNPEMHSLFEADQKVRQPGAKIDWTVVNKSDLARRKATLKLLNDGALHSGEDFNWAAFVFQHGSAPEDYLLAHTLAMVAVAKGYRDALWIGTATLDRFLQSIEQPQIYGTQYRTPAGVPVTQEPYNRELISDALRIQLGVPSQSAQEAQRKQYEAQRLAPALTK